MLQKTRLKVRHFFNENAWKDKHMACICCIWREKCTIKRGEMTAREEEVSSVIIFFITILFLAGRFGEPVDEWLGALMH